MIKQAQATCLFLVHEFRFQRDTEGRTWGSPAMVRWLDRYVDHSIRMVLFARDSAPEAIQGGYVEIPVDEALEVVALNSRAGVAGVAVARARAHRQARRRLRRHSGQLLVVRAPSSVGHIFARVARRRGIPYGVEVVGDPRTVAQSLRLPRAVRTRLGGRAAARMRNLVKGAASVLYVTRDELQRHYPPSPGSFTTHASNVELDDEWFRAVPAPRERLQRCVTTASLDFPYKGVDLLIAAIAALPSDVSCTIVGEGRLRPELEQMARAAGVEDRVAFVGRLDHEDLRALYAQADLYVSPSRSEGLPRAVIEAMAFGLPVVATSVGGMAELLPADDLVEPGSVAGLVEAISSCQPMHVRARQSARNQATARDYRVDVLARRRVQFVESLIRALDGAPVEI